MSEEPFEPERVNVCACEFCVRSLPDMCVHKSVRVRPQQQGTATVTYEEQDGEACWRIVLFDDKQMCVMHGKLSYTPRSFPLKVITEMLEAVANTVPIKVVPE